MASECPCLLGRLGSWSGGWRVCSWYGCQCPTEVVAHLKRVLVDRWRDLTPCIKFGVASSREPAGAPFPVRRRSPLLALVATVTSTVQMSGLCPRLSMMLESLSDAISLACASRW